MRSAKLLDRRRSLMLIIDMQERILPVIADAQGIEWNAKRLLEAAVLFGIPALASEQYPQRLGNTVQSLCDGRATVHSKRMFSCRECEAALRDWPAAGRNQLVVCGIETHVCVLQTVLDLLESWDVVVVADAVGSRNSLDHTTAIGRMTQAGAMITTTESVLFEWCETSADPNFKAISALVRSQAPGNRTKGDDHAIEQP